MYRGHIPQAFIQFNYQHMKLSLPKKFTGCIAIFFVFIAFLNSPVKAQQGTWTELTTMPFDSNEGVMLLLTDGTVMVKTATGPDAYGNVWDLLIPDSNGSYINGTWTPASPMNDTRLYFSSQVLRDGRVYVAGGEYGTGSDSAEIYNPLTDSWTEAPHFKGYIGDANSELLPDGKVLEAIVGTYSADSTIIFDPVANKWGSVAVCKGMHAETSWLMLADNSILFIDWPYKSSERYIPSLQKWIADGAVPDSIYDPIAYEAGPSLLLPDGRGFFMGATGHTAYYTPTGTASPGTWAAGPDVPNGYSTADAPGAMMPNGKILFTASPKPYAPDNYFPSPMSFFEFDYTTDSIKLIHGPGGIDTISAPCFVSNLLDLPDGTVLYANQYTSRYYIYKPVGKPLPAGKPTISNITQNGCTYTITGTLFNGISQGGDYGDDWQMFSNYPIVRMRKGNTVVYDRTTNWNRIAVQTGSLLDTAQFTVPAFTSAGVYWLVVIANGISSDSVSFVYTPCVSGIQTVADMRSSIQVYPNPAQEQVTLTFKSSVSGNSTIRMIDIFGRVVLSEDDKAEVGNNTHILNIAGLAKGVYMLTLQQGNITSRTKVVVN